MTPESSMATSAPAPPGDVAQGEIPAAGQGIDGEDPLGSRRAGHAHRQKPERVA